MAGWLKLRWIVVIFLLRCKVPVTCELKPDWTYDLITTEVENKTPDKVIFDLQATRIVRGVYGISGLIELKEDWNEGDVGAVGYYSMTGSNFVKTPFELLPTNLETFMNTHYKDFLQETFLNCSDNAPRIEDNFVPPLKKGTVHLKNCMFPNDNLPLKMKSGFYRIDLSVTKQFVLNFTIFTKVEPNN